LANKKIDLSELFGSPVKQDDRIFSKQLLSVYEFYLSGEIESSEQYIQWFDTIRHAGENDAIKIYINSPGGDLFTAIQFMKVLNETPATVIMSVEGQCASAATMIFLCGDTFEVSEHAMFMFHTYSGGAFGKGGEMYDQLQYERIWSEKLLREVYEGFLTDAEVASMIDSKDIWMSGADVIERLKIMKVQIEAKIKAEEAEEAEETETKAKPKKTRAGRAKPI
jgi:ATP-dependent protease ClpP protease subunit|tara:strand:- start:20 stop:688 length:669 start_codon:yes stop_codon:yes gene_type:complete